MEVEENVQLIGSGRQVSEINKFMEAFETTQKMMKNLNNKGKMKKMMKNLNLSDLDKMM